VVNKHASHNRCRSFDCRQNVQSNDMMCQNHRFPPPRSQQRQSLTNEWGRCAQGISKTRLDADRIIGHKTIFVIPPHKVPAGRKVTCSTFVCTTVHSGKAEACRIRMMVGNDKLDACQDICTPAVAVSLMQNYSSIAPSWMPSMEHAAALEISRISFSSLK
jgi:hypothetical protein